MGISRDTFDKLKHYVGVRLQQGVPLVDADWNEQEDIIKYELQAFLKWFVGDGVPKGNDGFKILSVVDKIILTSSKKNNVGFSSVQVKLEDSTAAKALDFGPDNYQAKRVAPPAAQLTGKIAGPFELEHNMTLAISVDDLPPVTVTFSGDDFKNISEATAAEVAEAINKAITDLTASVGADNDFDIKGGDGTPEGAGRCLVEGWDAINERNLKYTAQPLFNNPALAAKWGVDPVQLLTTPTIATPTPTRYRTDTVYLDVWEREVDAEEDYEHLVNPKIGIETCVRLKREWAVRVKEGANEPPTSTADHVFYPLAYLRREPGVAAIDKDDIKDLRRSGLAVLSRELTIKDGNVGIGTMTPTSLLDVLLGSIRARRDADQYIQIIDNSSGGGFITGHSRANNKKPLYIESLHDGGEGPKGETQMRFRVGNETSPTTAITIKEDGNVGIGTNNPEAKLHVNGNLRVNVGEGLEFLGENDYFGTNLDARIFRMIDVNSENGNVDGGIAIEGFTPNDNKRKPIMAIRGNGNVGIGTAQPEERLHVQGNIFASGLIYSGTRVLADRREKNVFQINPGARYSPDNPPPYSVQGMDCVIYLDVPAVINVYFNLDGLEFVEPGIGLLQCVRFLLYENDAEKESIRVGVQSNITISKVLELEAGEHSIEIKYAGCTLHGPRMLQTKGERRLLLHL
jgi:hypothetical protein